MTARETMVPLEADTLRPWIGTTARARRAAARWPWGTPCSTGGTPSGATRPAAPRAWCCSARGTPAGRPWPPASPKPAVSWLVARAGRSRCWPRRPGGGRSSGYVRRANLATGTLETWGASRDADPARDDWGRARLRPAVGVRRLGPGDASGLRRLHPGLGPEELGLVRPDAPARRRLRRAPRRGFATLAWVVEQDARHASIGVFTWPRYRRLGLGYAAASALMVAVVRESGRLPVWVTAAENEPSRGLAAAMGFAVRGEETLLRWPEPAGAGPGTYPVAGYLIELELSGARRSSSAWRRRPPQGRRPGRGRRRVIGVDPNPADVRRASTSVASPIARAHLAGASLAFAAATPEINRRVVADARAAGIWVNAASDPDSGDFRVPATRRDGPLLLGVSTGGPARPWRRRSATASGRGLGPRPPPWPRPGRAARWPSPGSPTPPPAGPS